MDSGIIFLAQVFLYAGFPIYLATLKNHFRLIYSYIYIALVLIMGGFLGAVYSLPLTDTITISGGSIAYGALMISTVILVIMERDLSVVRNIIWIVIGVNVFKLLLFSVISWALDFNGSINPFSTSASVFNVSIKFTIIGGVLILSELLLLVFLFEKIKTRIKDFNLLALLYLVFFVGVLCLDGVLFPLLALPFEPSLVGIIAGGVKSKLVLALAYGIPAAFFLFAFRKNLANYTAIPIRLQELVISPREDLVQEIALQQEAIEQSEERYRDLVENIQDLICTHDLKGILLFVNKPSAESLGYTPAELIGLNIRELIEPEYETRFDSYLKTIRQRGNAQGVIRVRTREGGIRVWEFHNTLRTKGVPEPIVRGMAHDITESIQAEEQLRYNASLFDEVNDAIISTDKNFKILAWNKAAEKIYGFSKEEMLGTVVGQKVQTEYLPPETAELVSETFLKNGSWKGEVIQTSRDGRRLNILSSVSKINDIQGNLVGTVAVNRDITNRKHAELVIQENEHFISAIADTTPTLIYVYDLETNSNVYANQKLEQILGFSAVELKAMGSELFARLIHPDDLPAVLAHESKLRSATDDEQLEVAYRMRHRNGSWRTLRSYERSFFRNPDGSLKQKIGAAVDITESIRAEIALRQAEQDYRSIFENAPIGIFQSTAAGQYIKVNPFMAEMYGYSSPRDMMENVQDIGHKLYVEPSERAEFKRKIEEDGYIADFENQIFRRDGSVIWISTYARAVKDAEGQTLYYEGFTSDITERRTTDEALRATQEFLTGLLENTPASIYVISEDHRFRMVNKGWEQERNIQREQALGSRIEDLFSADLADRFITDNQKVLDSKKPLVTDETVNDADGPHHYYTVKFPLRYLSSEFDAVGGFTFDITQRILAEQQRERLTKIMEASLNEIYIFDADTLQFEYVNEGACRNLGYDADTLRTLTPLDLKPEYTLATFQDLLAPLRRHEKDKVNFETVHRRADDSLYPVDVHIQPVEHGGNSSFLAMISDITERKLAEEKLRESERKYRQLVETSHDLIWSVDAQGIMTFINQAAERIYGYKPEELIGKHWTDIAMETDEKEAEKIAQEIGLKGGAVGGYIRKMRHRSGRDVILRADAVQHYDANGKYSGASGISQDVTEIVKANEEVRRSREQLRSLVSYIQTAIEEERAHIARNIHDEFGQMMTGLKMDMAWLERNTEVTTKQQGRLTEMNHLVDEAVKTIRRISSELRPGLLDDLGLISALEWLTNEYSRRSNLKFSIQLPPQEPDLEPGAKTALYRIFQESITNVIRHAGATQVDSVLQMEADEIVLRVMDNGSGIPIGILQNPTSLGLLSMQERAVRWGGAITILGADGQGTTVTVRMPVTSSPSNEEAI